LIDFHALTVSCLAEGAGNRPEKPVAKRCHGRGALDGIHDDGKDVDIRSCAKSFDRPPEAFA
jgi:hypothetical protein